MEEDVITIAMRDGDGGLVNGYLIEVGEEEDAIEELSEGEVEVIFLDEPAEPDDIEEVAEGGGGDLTSIEQERVLAVEGLAAIVSPQNPITSLTVADILGIVEGRITDWSDVGGTTGPINLYSYDEEDHGFHYIGKLVLEAFDIELRDDFEHVRTNQQLAAAVTSDPMGFGLVASELTRGAKVLSVVMECGIVSSPSHFNLKTEGYPLQRRVYAYNRVDVDEAARNFLAFLDSEDLDGLVAKAGFVDLGIIAESQNDGQTRINNMIAASSDEFELGIMRDLLHEMLASEPLSTMFRFETGSSFLDARARRDTARIARFIEERKPSEVLVVGFTDFVGAFDSNTALAFRRAGSVMSELRQIMPTELQARVNMRSIGYGELLPVACNETFKGRSVNRRVEIWIR